MIQPVEALEALTATGLSVGYRQSRKSSPVLSGLDIAVHAGELVCLLGPNGIGKSTLLRTIAGIQPPLGGSIRVGGAETRELGPLELARKIGIVLTERVAIGALSGRQVVELGRYPHIDWLGRLTPRDHEIVEWALEAAGASHVADRDSDKLSDGERQRLMIARAMAQEPLILILDEPTAFLDVASRVELMGLLRVLARDENLAIVLSTHDLELALRMADTIWLLMPGGSLKRGVPEDVIISGDIEAAFQAEKIAFQREERVFRPIDGRKGHAIVQGTGLGGALARAVLEREGYAIVESHPVDVIVTIDQASHWTATVGDVSYVGDSFATLARLAKGL